MKLRIYTKDTHELVYFCNTTGDPDAPETFEDGGSKAGSIREEMMEWILDRSPATILIVGNGDYLWASAALSLYNKTHHVIIDDLPEQIEPEPDPKPSKFVFR